MLRMALWPVTERAIERWVEDHQGEWESGSAFRFAVERQGVVVGQVDVDDIEGDAGDIGYWFDEAAWGQGFAGEAAAAATHFALNTLQLAGLYAGHAADNPASGKVLRRLGFEFVEDALKYSRPEGRDMPWRMYRMIRPST
jgi:RimJ/RimL family protein N-acetyltransferase